MVTIREGGVEIGIQGTGGSKGVALDAWNLNQTAHRVAGHTQVMLQSHLGSILHLCRTSTEKLTRRSRSHRTSHAYLALATAGLVGNIVKNNASISGADVGCQGEVGVACAMASAAACQLFGGSPAQVEYAAEMGLEHHLGMTCDPVCGLVQIPCIERNAFAAARALDADLYASFSDGHHSVSFDRVVEVMRQTGHDLPSLYKETSEGGLAKGFKGE